MADLKHSKALEQNPVTSSTADGSEIIALSIPDGGGGFTDGAILLSELVQYSGAGPISPHTEAIWSFASGSGSSVADVSGVGAPLLAAQAISANFWTDNATRGTFQDVKDHFGEVDTALYPVGRQNYSYLYSLKLNKPLMTGVTVPATLMGKTSGAVAEQEIITYESTTGILKYYHNVGGGNFTRSTGDVGNEINDGLDHHIVLSIDKGGVANCFIDGVKDATFGDWDMTSKAGDNNVGGFVIGTTCLPDYAGSFSRTMYVNDAGAVPVQFWDAHLYIVKGADPTTTPEQLMPTGQSLQDIVDFLGTNTGVAVPESLWA